MVMNSIKNCGLFLMLVLMTVGCIPYKTIVNYNEDAARFKTPQAISNYKPLQVEPNDILQIDVVSIESEAVAIFKDLQVNGFTVSPEGNIDFPLVGTIEVGGSTLEEVKLKLLSELKTYFIKAPTVNVRLANFKINVNGEVNNPGIFSINNDRVTIIEAITLAGDFTSFSRRDSVMIIREQGNSRVFGYVDFNSSETLNSPYFYLKQNDVVYVKPNKTKLGTIRNRESKIVPFVSVGLSLIILTITVFNLR